MNALPAAEYLRQLYRPGVLERGLKIVAQALDGREERAAIAQRIVALLNEREANAKALRAASARFKRHATPAPTVTYRGPFGPIEIDVDGDWIREALPDFSPRSRRGRRLRKLLRLHDEHYAQLWADREASGVGPLVDEQKRIEAELEAAAKEACSLGGHSVADVALQAAALLAVKLVPATTTARPLRRSYRRCSGSQARRLPDDCRLQKGDAALGSAGEALAAAYAAPDRPPASLARQNAAAVMGATYRWRIMRHLLRTMTRGRLSGRPFCWADGRRRVMRR
jgi:hypothetical protein